MLYNSIICLVFFLEMLISYYFFSSAFERKLKPIYCLTIGMALFETGAFFDIVLSSIIWFNALWFAVVNFAFCMLCFKISFAKGLVYSVIIDVFSATLEVAAIFIISVFTNTEITAYKDDLSFLVVDSSISKLLLFVVLAIMTRFVSENKSKTRLPIFIYAFPILSLAALIIFWDICAKDNISDNHKLYLSLLSVMLLSSTIVLFISYQHRIEMNNRFIMLEKEVERNETDRRYFDILKKQNEELMIYAHDTKNHLAAISELNDNIKIADYINQMSNELKVHSSTCHSGNKTLDIIINKYVTECDLKSVSFTFDVKASNLDNISDYDLVTILGNLLDNALEAAERSEAKTITFITNKINTYDSLVITNSCDTPPDKKLKTTKDNKKSHGIGLKSVNKTLKKYSGELDLEYDNNKKQFITTVILLEKAI